MRETEIIKLANGRALATRAARNSNTNSVCFQLMKAWAKVTAKSGKSKGY